MKTRYSAQYIDCLQDMDPFDAGQDWNPDDIAYHTVTGSNLASVIKRAQELDINGECYAVHEEQYQGGGLWQSIQTFDPYFVLNPQD